MDSLHSYRQNKLTATLEASSIISFIEEALTCVREGRYSEGVAFLSLARAKLSTYRTDITPFIDAFIQDYISYWQAQQVLYQASKHLVEAQTKQQTQITSLEKLLSMLKEEVDNTTDTLTQLPKNFKEHELPQKSQLFPTPKETKSDRSSLSSLEPPLFYELSLNSALSGEQALQLREESQTLPALYFICFGHFEVKRSDQTISLCSNRNGQAILRYLVAQSAHRATMDILMALLWPDDEPEVAHHKLQVAISALRRSLNNGYTTDQGGGYILYKNGVYQLNPVVSLRSDVDEFLALHEAGRQTSGQSAVVQYEAACRLYTGPFLTEDLYADWSLIQREQLSQAHSTMCRSLSEYYFEHGHYEVATKWAHAILENNHCDEAAHRLLIQIYAAQGQRNEALRQFQRCKQVLAEEMGMSPLPETVKLFHSVSNSKIVSNDRIKIQPRGGKDRNAEKN